MRKYEYLFALTLSITSLTSCGGSEDKSADATNFTPSTNNSSQADSGIPSGNESSAPEQANVDLDSNWDPDALETTTAAPDSPPPAATISSYTDSDSNTLGGEPSASETEIPSPDGSEYNEQPGTNTYSDSDVNWSPSET
jgi:hypothetical protein